MGCGTGRNPSELTILTTPPLLPHFRRKFASILRMTVHWERGLRPTRIASTACAQQRSRNHAQSILIEAEGISN